jgi:hypothetical protein
MLGRSERVHSPDELPLSIVHPHRSAWPTRGHTERATRSADGQFVLWRRAGVWREGPLCTDWRVVAWEGGGWGGGEGGVQRESVLHELVWRTLVGGGACEGERGEEG